MRASQTHWIDFNLAQPFNSFQPRFPKCCLPVTPLTHYNQWSPLTLRHQAHNSVPHHQHALCERKGEGMVRGMYKHRLGKCFAKLLLVKHLQPLHTSFLVNKKCFHVWPRFYNNKKHYKMLKMFFKKIFTTKQTEAYIISLSNPLSLEIFHLPSQSAKQSLNTFDVKLPIHLAGWRE